MFVREIYFDAVRKPLFYGTMNQGQVDGQNAILAVWEKYVLNYDVRWLAYMLATTIHETASTMLPVAEYGKGSGQPYGKTDPETGQKYYGRGFVQTTWRDNYRRADLELGLTGDKRCEWDADLQLEPRLAAATMFLGMHQGWFRSKDGAPETLGRHFNDNLDDPNGARNIINGDQNVKPSWGGGLTVPEIISGYHRNFLKALEAAWEDAPAPKPPEPEPEPETEDDLEVVITIEAPPGVDVVVRQVEA